MRTTDTDYCRPEPHINFKLRKILVMLSISTVLLWLLPIFAVNGIDCKDGLVFKKEEREEKGFSGVPSPSFRHHTQPLKLIRSQKPKLKVGKAKAKPDNFTDTSFRAKCMSKVSLLSWSFVFSWSMFCHTLSYATAAQRFIGPSGKLLSICAKLNFNWTRFSSFMACFICGRTCGYGRVIFPHDFYSVPSTYSTS